MSGHTATSDAVFLAKVEAAHELAAEITRRKELERLLVPDEYDVTLANRLDAIPGQLNPGGEPVVYMAVVESQRKKITRALRRDFSPSDAPHAELVKALEDVIAWRDSEKFIPKVEGVKIGSVNIGPITQGVFDRARAALATLTARKVG